MVKEWMEDLFKPFPLGPIRLANRFVFPPVKLGYGDPDGTVTERQLLFYRHMTEHPEEFLEYSDWMGIPIQGYPVTLDRFKSLLLEQVKRLGGSD